MNKVKVLMAKGPQPDMVMSHLVQQIEALEDRMSIISFQLIPGMEPTPAVLGKNGIIQAANHMQQVVIGVVMLEKNERFDFLEQAEKLLGGDFKKFVGHQVKEIENRKDAKDKMANCEHEWVVKHVLGTDFYVCEKCGGGCTLDQDPPEKGFRL